MSDIDFEEMDEKEELAKMGVDPDAPISSASHMKVIKYVPPNEDEAFDESSDLIRLYTRTCYMVQKQRIAMGNRLVACFKKKLGIKPGQSEEEATRVAKTIMDEVKKAYSSFTEGVVTFPKTYKHFQSVGILTEYAELQLTDMYFAHVRLEQYHFKCLENLLEEQPLYTDFLKTIVGIGPAAAAIFISEIDIEKSKYPSSLHRLAGVDVAKWIDENGVEHAEGRSNRRNHLVIREYLAADGTIKTKLSITYNPFLHNKILGVIVPTLIKLGKVIDKETGVIKYKNKYAQVYDNYKQRKDQEFAMEEKRLGIERKPGTLARLHKMSIRYVARTIFTDYYNFARALKGLKVYAPYEIEYLGVDPHDHVTNTPDTGTRQGPVPTPEAIAKYHKLLEQREKARIEKKAQREAAKLAKQEAKDTQGVKKLAKRVNPVENRSMPVEE